MHATRTLRALPLVTVRRSWRPPVFARQCRRGRRRSTLKAAVFVPPTTTYGIPFKRFVDRVNETGKGVLQIRIVGGPEAVPGNNQADAVKSGVLDIASIPPAYYKSNMVEGDAQILSDMTVAEQRASGAYAMLNKIANDRMNAVYLTTYGMGVPFHLYLTKDAQVAKPEDLKGMRLRGAAELQRDLQALQHRQREHRAAGGVHRARTRRGAGLWLSALGHRRFRLGQADQGADRSRLL